MTNKKIPKSNGERQKELRERDKKAGHKNYKFRVSNSERNMMQAVQAEMSMGSGEAIVALFTDKARALGLSIAPGIPYPSISRVTIRGGGETANMLTDATAKTSLPANIVLRDALIAYMKDL